MRAKVGASLLILGLLCLAAPLGAAAPEYVEVDGEWELDRRLHDACVVAVPDVIGGSIHIEADFVQGWISGWIEGDGDFTSSYTLPAECEHDDPDDYDKTHLETWTGTLSNISGEFEGEFDTATGAFELEVSIYVDSVGEASAPGRQYMCNTDSWTQTCDLGPIYTDQLADISGVVSPGGVSDGEIDWYTAFCATVSPGRTDWGDNCPTLGWWEADPTDVIWGKNEPPEVGEIGSSPAEPNSQDTITFSVTATDSDGDQLSYTWYFDGVIDPASGPSASWRKPTPGDHEIEVDVSDGVETIERYLTIRVSEAVGAGDQDDDGVPDDEDLCPTEWGQGEDGCPPFAAMLGCTPTQPLPEDSVTCSVTVAGVHVGETVEYEWYLDGDGVGSGGASWTWAKSADGDHEVLVDVLGQGRTATASLGLEVGGGVVDKETAGFFIQNLACNSNITSDEILGCTATLKRDRDDVGALTVTWRIDGQTASRESVPGNTSSWTLDRPAPGDHTVQALVVDPGTNYAQLASAPATVRPGQNYPIPPGVQAMAAGLSMLTIGGWLWLEHLTRRREAALAAPPLPRTDVPDWVFDKRPLAQIWADEAAAEAARRGIQNPAWNPTTETFYTEDWVKARVDEAMQRNLKDQWWRLNQTLGDNPAWDELHEFVKENESNIFRGDRIDPDQMARLQRAVQKLGRADLGLQAFKDYTYIDFLKNTALEASESFIVRAGLASFTGGLSELVFVPGSTYLKMERRVMEGGWSVDQAARAAKGELILYGGLTVAVVGGIHGFGGLLARGAQGAATAVGKRLPEAWREWGRSVGSKAVSGVKGAYEIGQMPAGRALRTASRAYQLYGQGAKSAWQTAAEQVLIDELRAGNAQLGSLVDDLYQAMQKGAGGIREAPTLTFTAQNQKHLWGLTDDAFKLTHTEQAAARILGRMPREYRQAVQGGLVPTRLHQVVNHTRDKMIKHAAVRAYRGVRTSVRSGLQRIEFSGTGARPTSGRASAGWTDVDATAVGAEDAERAFAAEWYREMRRGGNGMPSIAPRQVDASVFSGRVSSHSPEAFHSQALLDWRNVDYQFSGRAATPTSKGNLLFGQHPDAALRTHQVTGLWTLETPHRLQRYLPGSIDTLAARADAARMIDRHHAAQAPSSPLADLNQNGKYAVRIWKIENVGTGAPVPEGITVLEHIKRAKPSTLPTDQLRQAERIYQQTTGRTAGATV